MRIRKESGDLGHRFLVYWEKEIEITCFWMLGKKERKRRNLPESWAKESGKKKVRPRVGRKSSEKREIAQELGRKV